MFPVEDGDTTRPPHVVDILPALSLVLLLLGEMQQQAERLRRLDGNLRSRKVAERRRSEAVDDGQPRRPVGRPRGSKNRPKLPVGPCEVY
jgi:hypothetical protein